MFENLIKKLEDITNEMKNIENETNVSIPILPDSEGNIDKECPNEECLYSFKVNLEDWKNNRKDNSAYCPMCRHKAPENSWWDSDQLKNGKDQLAAHIRERLINAWSGKPNQLNFLPIPAKEEMTLKIQCTECNSKYSVIGSAFFCPCCGFNCVERTLDESLKKVEIKLSNLEIIRKAIELNSKDQAEVTCRSLIESALIDCVVAFQRFCEASFTYKKPNEKLPFNVFQRLDGGSEIWEKNFNEGYHDWLTSSEFNRINIYFNRRHLLSHTEGIVDDKYLQKSKDSTYVTGQRIIVNENDVKELLILTRKLVTKIRLLN